MFKYSICWVIVWTFIGSPVYAATSAATPTEAPVASTRQCLGGSAPTPDSTVNTSVSPTDHDNIAQSIAPGAEDGPTTFISKSSVTSTDLGLTTQLDLYGTYNTSTNGWDICQDDVQKLYAAVPFAPSTKTMLDAFSIDRSRISFKNPRDLWALTGEPCRKYLQDGTCDETLSPDGKTPLYYDDTYWPNNHWDAPKADARILTTLVYLVTPTSEGGAGHEHITVGQIIQDSKKNKEFQTTSTKDGTANEQADQTLSAHYYDQDNPEHPSIIAQSLEITEIDAVRVTTKITQKHHSDSLGITHAKNTFQYKSFPLKVAWQTDEGIAKDPPPNITDLYSGSLANFSTNLGGILDSLDLEATVDPTSLNLSSLGDIAQYVGNSLLQNLLQGGSLKGWDLPSTLDSFGRSYLSQQLGLPKGAFSEGDTIDDVVRNVGRVTAEKNLQLPTGSLKGNTSEAIYQNVGARYLEQNIFNIREGTLTRPISNQGQLLQRLGAGKIEQALGLKPGSAQDTDFNGLKKANYKTESIFTDQSAASADDDLALVYAESPLTKARNLSESSFTEPTKRLIHGQLPLSDYEQLVGIRAWDSGIGQYSAAPAEATAAPPTSVCESFKTCKDNQTSTTIAKKTGISFAPYFLEQLGVNVSKLPISLATPRPSRTTNLGHTPKLPAPESIDSIVSTAMNSDRAKKLLSTNAYTDAQLRPMLSQMATLVRGTSSQPSMGSDQKLSKAHDELQVISYWREQLQTGLGEENATLSRSSSDDTFKPSDDSVAMASFLQQSMALNNSDADIWTDTLAGNGQSGQSAATNIPGIMSQLDSNGIPTDQKLTTGDPFTELASGNMASLAAIGKLQLAKQVTDNPSSRYILASQLKPDLSASFNTISSILKPIADVSKLTGSGLETDDFVKIFQKNLGPEVFYRVGQEALLAKAWDKSGATNAVNSAAQSTINQVNSTIGKISDTLDTIASDITFYTSRYETLQSEAAAIANGSNGVSADVRQSLKDIASRKNVNLYDSIRKDSSNLQTLFKQASTQEKGVQEEVAQAEHTIDEIIAGHALSFTQGTNTSNSSSQSAVGCWSKDSIRSALLHGSNKFRDTATQAGACQMETALSLPTGSVFNWYTQGKETGKYTLDDFESNIGKADFGQGTFSTLTQAKDRGQKVLEGRGVGALLANMPGVAKQAASFGITGDTIVQMLQGNSAPTLKKLGEGVLDTKMHWQTGTAGNMIDPICHLDGTPCTTKERDSARISAAAQMGMKDFGINLGLPPTLDITGSGNFSTLYGRASVSESLGLSANSFTGPFKQLLSKNTPLVVMNMLGLTDTSTGQSLAQSLQSAQSKNAPSAADLAQIKQINSQLDADRSALLDQAANINSNLYQGAKSPLQQKLEQLDQSNNVPLGTFKSYVTGSINAEAITEKVGSKQAKEKLSNDVVNAALDATGNTGLRGVVDSFKTFGKKAGCDEGDSLADYFTGGGAGCSLKALSKVDFKSLFNNVDTQNSQLRGALYDELLTKGFGANIESKLNLTPGVIRNLIVNPRQAKEIAMSEGFNAVADQIFGKSDDSTTDAQKKRQGIHDAFLAGFFDVTTNTYTTTFNATRSVSLLAKALDGALDNSLQGLSQQKLGITMTSNDLSSLLSGNTDTMLYLGAEKFASNTNAALLGTNDPRAAKFQLNFTDLRTAINGGVVPPEAFTQNLNISAANQERHLFLEGKIDCTKDKENIELCGNIKLSLDNPSAALDQQIVGKTTTSSSPDLIGVSNAGLEAGLPASAQTISSRKNAAQKNLQFQMYDIAAFKLDHNIPPGFSKAMTDGSSAERSNMVGQYAFSALIGKDAGLGKYVSASDFGVLSKFVTSGFSPESAKDLTQSSINGVSSWATDQFQKSFGVSLPPGAILGVMGWASTGFDRNQFSSNKIASGPFACADPKSCKFSNIIPIGTVLKDWGEEKIFAWGDKVLGFKTGDTYKIYAAGKKVADAQHAISVAHAAHANAASVQAAKANNAAAIASVVLIIVEIVFAKQIAEAETQLGLVPGTGGMALGLLATAILHSFLLGPAVAPIAIILFIGVELFGVYKTVTETKANADGYYPNHGSFGDKGLADSKNASTYQYPSPDYQMGDFDATDQTKYHNGLKLAAQTKVQSVIADILLMPERWAGKAGIDPSKLEASQIFTDRPEDISSLDYLISRPSPRDTPAGFGYGPLSERCDIKGLKQDPTSKAWSCPPSGNRFGVFQSPLFFDKLHVRW